MAPVQCRNCGFLSVRDFKSRELLEVDETMREKWELHVIPNDEVDLCKQHPLCATLAALFAREIGTRPGYVIDKKAVVAVLKKDRECETFIQWVPGFSPKEHMKMHIEEMTDKWQEEQRRRDEEWRAEQRAAELRWQEEQKAEERRWQEEQKAIERQWQARQKRWDYSMTVVVAILTFLLGYLVKHQPPSVPSLQQQQNEQVPVKANEK